MIQYCRTQFNPVRAVWVKSHHAVTDYIPITAYILFNLVYNESISISLITASAAALFWDVLLLPPPRRSWPEKNAEGWATQYRIWMFYFFFEIWNVYTTGLRYYCRSSRSDGETGSIAVCLSCVAWCRLLSRNRCVNEIRTDMCSRMK